MHSNQAWKPVLFPTVCQLNFQIVMENGLCLCRWVVFPCCSGSLPLCSSWGSALGERPSHRPEQGLPAIWISLEHKERCQQEALKWLLSGSSGITSISPGPWLGNFTVTTSNWMYKFWALYFVSFHAWDFVATYYLLTTLSRFEEFPFPTVGILPPQMYFPSFSYSSWANVCPKPSQSTLLVGEIGLGGNNERK